MIEMPDDEFEQLVNDGFNTVSKLHMDNLDNIAIVIEDEPSASKRKQLALRCNQTLFGLFEGVPRPQKSSTAPYSMPDKITIFKKPLLAYSKDISDLKNNVRNTVWHEIAHYYGLNHTQIHKLEK